MWDGAGEGASTGSAGGSGSEMGGGSGLGEGSGLGDGEGDGFSPSLAPAWSAPLVATSKVKVTAVMSRFDNFSLQTATPSDGAPSDVVLILSKPEGHKTLCRFLTFRRWPLRSADGDAPDDASGRIGDRAGWCVGRAAESLDVSIRDYREIEAGDRSPNWEEFDLICKLCAWYQTFARGGWLLTGRKRGRIELPPLPTGRCPILGWVKKCPFCAEGDSGRCRRLQAVRSVNTSARRMAQRYQRNPELERRPHRPETKPPRAGVCPLPSWSSSYRLRRRLGSGLDG